MVSEVEPGAGRLPQVDLGAGVIRAKLAPDRLPRGSVSRPQLLDALRRGRDRALTLVSAPAGFGKTTLLTEWFHADTATSFAWVTLDPSDAEPVRLWTHVIAAIAQHERTVGDRSLHALRSNPDRIADVALPILIDELIEGTGDLVVILDDFHLAETSRSSTSSPSSSAIDRHEFSSSCRLAPTPPSVWPDCAHRETSSSCAPRTFASTTPRCPGSSTE